MTCKYITFCSGESEKNRSESIKQKNHSDSVLLKNLEVWKKLGINIMDLKSQHSDSWCYIHAEIHTHFNLPEKKSENTAKL